MSDQAQPPAAPEDPSAHQPAESGAPNATTQPAGASAEKNLDQLLADAQARIEEQRETLLRALADAENARKRAQLEVLNAHKFGLEKFAETLLPVVDSLEAALETENATTDTLKSGAELTLKQLRAALDGARIDELAPSPGERFDPNWHQAMAAVAADAEPNTIVAVLQKGWRLHDRVLRPALVTVAKAAPSTPANDA
jgi:molecular chaperone GrpE